MHSDENERRLSMNLKTLALILKGLRVSGSWSQCMRKKTERGLSMNLAQTNPPLDPSQEGNWTNWYRSPGRGWGRVHFPNAFEKWHPCGDGIPWNSSNSLTGVRQWA